MTSFLDDKFDGDRTSPPNPPADAEDIMQAGDCCFILFQAQHVGLDDADRELRKRGLQVQRQRNRLSVACADQFLRIYYAEGSEVREEAEGIGEEFGHAAELKQCNCRFEIMIDDLDAALQEINSLIDIQLSLQSLTNGFIFACWNMNLIPPTA